MKKLKTSTLVNITFWLGWVSVFLWQLSIIPIVTIIFGSMTLIRFHSETDKDGRGYTILGLVLGIVFLIVRLMQ
jgi:hypothetical protein